MGGGVLFYTHMVAKVEYVPAISGAIWELFETGLLVGDVIVLFSRVDKNASRLERWRGNALSLL